MSREPADERRRRRHATANVVTPTTKLARGTRDDVDAVGARGTRDSIEPMIADSAVAPIDHEESDTVVVDTDEHSSVLDEHAEDHLDLSGSDDSIDAHMLELGKRRFGISAFRPG